MKDTAEDTAAMETYVKLVRATESVTASIHRHLHEHGLTISQFGVLEALYHKGPLCQRDIGKKILKSSGNITTVIDNLEKRGLVKRKRSEDDRRYFAVNLTGDGEALVKKIFPTHAAGVADRMSALNDEELRDLARLCKKLGTGG